MRTALEAAADLRHETIALAANLLRRPTLREAAKTTAEVCACWWVAVKMEETHYDPLHCTLRVTDGSEHTTHAVRPSTRSHAISP